MCFAACICYRRTQCRENSSRYRLLQQWSTFIWLVRFRWETGVAHSRVALYCRLSLTSSTTAVCTYTHTHTHTHTYIITWHCVVYYSRPSPLIVISPGPFHARTCLLSFILYCYYYFTFALGASDLCRSVNSVRRTRVNVLLSLSDTVSPLAIINNTHRIINITLYTIMYTGADLTGCVCVCVAELYEK